MRSYTTVWDVTNLVPRGLYTIRVRALDANGHASMLEIPFLAPKA